MESKLSIISYNCNSFNANTVIINELLKKCDVLCLQETLIDDNNFQVLDTLNECFSSAYVSATRKNDCFVGRSSGGLVIYWKNFDEVKFEPITFTNRIMGLRITFPNNTVYLILNIYCICDYGTVDALIEYKSTLADLHNILQNEFFHDVFITGDFNADPFKGRFFSEFSKFANENFIQISDISNLPADSYTYISNNNDASTSWLDHVAVSSPGLVFNVEILYGCTFYDHVPLFFNVHIPQLVSFSNVNMNNQNMHDIHLIDWDKVSSEDKEIYSDILDELSSTLKFNSLICNFDACCNHEHKNAIDDIYDDILEIISCASNFLPHIRPSFSKQVVGWNEYCRDLYSVSRQHYFIWHNNGRMRFGDDFIKMKDSRSNFKKALNYCKNNELKIRKENVLQKFNSRNKSLFWRSISKIKGTKTQNILSMDGNSNADDIVSIFDEKYKMILNDDKCQNSQGIYAIRTSSGVESPFLFIENIDNSIIELNSGLGWDGVHSNHIKYAGPMFRKLLTHFLNLVLFHSHVPKKMLFGEIRPIIKNNAMSKSDSNNFRPIMNSSMFLKTFEYCLLPIFSKHIRLNSRQFGFRKHTGCLSAIAVVKETIFHYNSEMSDVYCASIDCSKAFDKINWAILLQKLSGTSLPKIFVDIIFCMYANSYVSTRFNGVNSDPWKVGNGTRQGGILSPFLFSYYIDEILHEISTNYDGCSLMGYKTNIICYADDIICLSPSLKGLQTILNRTADILKKLCLSVNAEKSNFIIFRQNNRRIPQICHANVFLNGVRLEQSRSIKYLGVILSDNNDLGLDVDRVLNSFLKQFNSLYAKFSFVHRDILFFLFKSFATSFYGIETWFGKPKIFDLNRISVAYHKAVKRISGFNVWDSNHTACELVNVPIFKHLIAKRMICFWHNIIHSKSLCMTHLNYYFKYRSKIFMKIYNFFTHNYQVDILQNPLCAILSRISFIERNEPRSHYVY